MEEPMEEQLRRDSLEYHRFPTAGKISITPTKTLMNQRDLALAYSPGVAYSCLAVKDNPDTASTVAAATLNGLAVVGKDLRNVRLACSGAGAGALACLDQLVSLGLRPENIMVTDLNGVVYEGRTEAMDPIKARYARPTSARTLGNIIEGADIFLGLSAGGVLKADMVERMARDPLILALANPNPEIAPEE